MNPEIRVYRKALAVVAISGIVVGALAAGVAGMLAGADVAVAALLGALLGSTVALIGPLAMLVGSGRPATTLVGTVAAGWLASLIIALVGLALARGYEHDKRVAFALTFAAVVLVGLLAKAVVTAKWRVPYVDPREKTPGI